MLYITLSETEEELRDGAASHGWSLDGIDIFELKAVEQRSLGGDVSLFHPGEVELGEAMKTLLEEVDATQSARASSSTRSARSVCSRSSRSVIAGRSSR